MLHRGFKGGKCKISLKLAVARIKLMKNKREVNLRQMKRDLAKLLETGQEQTARIRVEHVVREEKTMSAYDLIEIYCELVVARLPIIESQKTCPVDLKEAIASLVFAAPRCEDIPELADIRKHFTAKYGKEFITSALELRPGSGVSRQVIEKLSANAPDGETKIKILAAIAKEHNVNWDRKDFEEKELKPPEDLLNGPNIYDTGTKMGVESPSVQPQPTPVQKYYSSGPSMSSQDYATTNATSSMPRKTSSPAQFTTSEHENKGRDFRDSSHEEQTVLPTGGQNWNMEFKDATAAAHAAAESAERASRAARAAAEIASGRKDIRQYSPESRESSSFDYSGRNDRHPTSTGPNVRGERVNQEPVRMTYESPKSSSKNVDPRMQNQQREMSDSGSESRYHGYDGNARNSVDDRRSVGNLQRADRKSQKNTSKVESISPIQEGRERENRHFNDEVRIHDQFTDDPEVEFVDQQHNGKKTEYTNFPLGGQIRVQPGKSVSPSCASTEGDEAHSDSEMRHYGSDLGRHSFNSTLNENTRKETMKSSFKDNSNVVFDEYDFEEDGNLGVEDVDSSHEFDSYAPLPIRESPPHAPPIIDSWTPRKNKSGSTEENFGVKSDLDMESHSPLGLLEMLSKGSGPSKPDGLLSVAFDDYPESECDEETYNYDHSGKTSTAVLPLEHNVSITKAESTETNIGHGIARSSFKKENEAYQKPSTGSSYDPESEHRRSKRNQEIEASYVGESEKGYNGRGSELPSFSKREAALSNRKPDLPSSSDDSEAEEIYGSRDRKLGSIGEYSKRSGGGSKQSSFIKREAATSNIKPNLPSFSDDSESEGINGSHDRQLGAVTEYSKRSGGGGGGSLGVNAFPAQTNSPRNRDQELWSEDKQRLRTSRVLSPGEKQAEDTAVALKAESKHRRSKRNQEIEASYVGESEKGYNGRGSELPSFSKREAARSNRKPDLPSSSDDSESEEIYGSRDRKLGSIGEYSKRSGGGSKPSSFIKREAARSNIKPNLPSSSDDSESEGINGSHDRQLGAGSEYSKRSGGGGGGSLGVNAFPAQTNSPRNRDQELWSEDKQRLRTSRVLSPGEKQAEDTAVALKSSSPVTSSESGQGLNFGRLPGGLRNKVTRPTRTENPLDVASPRLTQQTAEDTPKFKSSRTKARDPELLNQQPQKVHRESSSRSPKSFFDSDSDDSDLPKRQTVRRSDYHRGGLTYKPRHTPSESDASNLAMFVGGHELPETSHTGEREKASYGSGSIAMPQMENSGRKTRVNLAGKESSKSEEEQSYRPVLQPKVSVSKESSKSRLQNTSPSVEKQPPEPIPEPKTVGSDNSETVAKNASSASPATKKPSSLEGSTSRENSLKKVSHVHPKLPDFDAFTAHFHSLRSNVRPSS